MTAPATLIRRPRIAPVWRRPLAIVGILFVSFWFITMIIVPFLPLADPLAQDFTPLSPPSGTHPFGTDILGRDVLSRTLFGSRATLPFAILLLIISLILGSLVGAIAGYFGGVIDEIIMRIADLVFAFPTIVLAMVVAAALGPGITNGVIRSLVLSARNQEYVVAGRLLGAGPLSSLRRDILPNVASPMLVLAMLDLGS